ncbi:MAG TPA: MTH938/NDUFAF3 family protein [Candidatus Acidoferrales bacterium]|nr:MTH938/NDUFAF3 family protein [Candidatus Acidoferrales bacterium]
MKQEAMIEKYEFGRLQVDGKEYSRDVIIYPKGAPSGQRVDASWWRKEGHRLDKADLDEVTKAKPEVLVVGTGYYGCMKVPKETIEFVRSLGIELYAQPTKEACQKYNELKDAKRVVAALHLTC